MFTDLIDYEVNEDSWFGPIPSASTELGTCANDTHGVRELNIEYCPAKAEAELDLSSFQYVRVIVLLEEGDESGSALPLHLFLC